MEPTEGEVNYVDGQVPKPSVLDDLPLMWWKKDQQEFPRLAHMTRKYLTTRIEKTEKKVCRNAVRS